ncbi:MAG TPA: type II toxin-antitoxin system RelE/ParE family toxin [Acidimicrobiales bacterium]
MSSRPASAWSRGAKGERPSRCVALKGEDRAYRVRVGDHRVVYEVHADRLVVLVIWVGHRRDVYKP